MNDIFCDYLDKFVIANLDDTLIYSKIYKAILEHVQNVFSTLRRESFYEKLSKWCFGSSLIEKIGHFISRNGISMKSENIKAIHD